MFLLIVNGKVPSYLGTSAAFVAAVAAIRAQGGNSADVTGAILIAGLILAAVGVIVHFGGSGYVRAVLPPVVTGAVVMLIGFSLAAVATITYYPQDQWIALLTTAFLIGMAVLGPGFLSRIAIFLALVFGYVISWIADQFSTVQSCTAAGKCMAVPRIDWSGVAHAPWIGLPGTVVSPTFGTLTGPHLPAFKLTSILFGFCPKFGAVVAATPGWRPGGITLVLYGMIGLLGAKIWIENRVNFADPVNLVPLAAGITAGIGNLTIKVTSTFSIAGIATGTLMVIIGYHAVRPFARRPPDEIRRSPDEPQPGGGADEGGTMIVTGHAEIPHDEGLAYRAEKQPPGSGTGQPVAVEDGVIRSPDEGTGSVPP
jgi:xanthine/uracil permease